MKTNVSLIGMPGAGKSVVGRGLADHLGWRFVDTDRLIEEREGAKLQGILDDAGYLAVRRLEEATILTLKLERCVIATGGSAVYSQSGMSHLQEMSTIVFLDIDLATVKQRVRNFDQRGIACAQDQTLEAIFAERYPLYRQYAEITLANSKSGPEQAVLALAEGLGQN